MKNNLRITRPDCVEAIAIVFLIVLGYALIENASQIQVDLEQKVYPLELNMKLENGETKSFNSFLWEHDFSKKGGALSFQIVFNNSIEVIELDFPWMMLEKDMNLTISTCNSQSQSKVVNKNCNEISARDLEIHLGYSPIEITRHTKLTIEKPPNLQNYFIQVAYFNSNLKPKGVFFINHLNNNLYDGGYSINFQIGDNYQCIENCLVKDEGKGFEPYLTSDVNNIVLDLDDSKGQSWFKLETIDEELQTQKERMNAMGIAIFASSFMLGVTFIVNLIKRYYETK